MRYYNDVTQNKNAVIGSRIDRTGKARTETQRRDEGSVLMAASTDQRNNSTRVFIDFPFGEGTVRLTGREARSLYRVLRTHYGFVGKSRRA
jgi:hypothetical protein